MEEFENEQLHTERDHTEPRESEPQSGSTYSGAGVGRKESPFADSPYVMNHREQNTRQEPWQEPRYGSEYVPPVKPAKQKKQKKGSGKVWKGILSAVLTVALVAAGCGITASMVNSRWEAKTDSMMVQMELQIRDLQERIENASNSNISVGGVITAASDTAPGQVYAQNVRSVVLITCEVTSSYYGQTVTGTSSGSGFILTEDGYVITNCHVVEGASSIYVTTYDNEKLEAKLVGSDSTNDVAVLKVEAQGLDAVTIGSSDALAVGDQVVAIGNPLGELTSTMTVGYVSAKDRDVTTDGTTINMIQTDAAINSGNSGGPMFNMKGEVVGITTAKYSGESSSGATIEGIGFAIPIDDAMPLVEDLMNYGYVNSAYLGVMVSDMDSDTAAYYGLPVGAYIQEVTPGYCAEAAGLQAKDIITGLGVYEISCVSDLTKALRKYEAGDTTTITVYRGGVEQVLTITLDEKPQTTETETQDIPESGMPQDGSYEEWYNYFAPFFGKGNG